MRHRVAVVVVSVAALVFAAGLGRVLPGGRAAAPLGAEALASVLVDTPQSMLGGAVVPGDETIQRRAVLLAGDMTTAAATSRIARDARVPRASLAVVGPQLDLPTVPGTLAERAARASGSAVRASSTVTLRVDASVPIISVGTRAREAGLATRLAAAVVSALRDEAVSAGTERVRPLGRVRSQAIVAQPGGRRRKAAIAIVAAIFWVAAFAAVRAAPRCGRA